MQKIIKWFQKNLKWICLVLFIMLTLKCCQSCAKTNEIEFAKQSHEQVTDSLEKEILYRDTQIMLYKDSINVLKNQIENNNALIETLNTDKKNYQRISEQLAKNEKKKK